MFIFDLPSRRFPGGLRVLTVGSCRVHDPFEALHRLGELKQCDRNFHHSHSLGEALQALQAVMIGDSIPPEFGVFVYGRMGVGNAERLARTLADRIDVVLLEVPSVRRLRCEGTSFNQNCLSRFLIQPHRGALLAWNRMLDKTGAADEACVAAALEKLQEAGFPPDPVTERVLRNTRLGKVDAEELESTIASMVAMIPARWVVMGAATVEGASGDVMADRRGLNASLKQISDRLGATFYDPSQLIVDHGREAVFRNDGANIHEYSEAFFPTIGRAFIDQIRAAAGNEVRKSRPPSSRADRINDELVELHRDRLAELGPSGSGLYTLYEGMLARNTLIKDRERTVQTLIERYLPPYDGYAVLRAGLGEAAFLIAASGRKVVAYEPNSTRRRAIEAGLEHLEYLDIIQPGLMSISAELTPAGPIEGRVLGVALDATEFHDEAAAAPHLDRVAAFTDLLIDPRLFLRLREGFAEQDAVVAALGERGFARERDYAGDRLIWLRRGIRPRRARDAPGPRYKVGGGTAPVQGEESAA